MSSYAVVSLKGLHAESLGTYLASLGLLSLVARKWPTARACWKDARFCLVGGPRTLDELLAHICEIGETNTWTDYSKPWDDAKRSDVKKKSSTHTAIWRALEAEEQSLRLFGAHLAIDGRVRMNPLLGTGGNAGKRMFAKGWSDAVSTIRKPPRKWSREVLSNDLGAFLSGGTCKYLDSFQSGSWFGTDNKIYNHGNLSTPLDSGRGRKRPYREGEITPWAMPLACEGLAYLAGGPSRRLGSRRQPSGAFPFVVTAPAPKGEGEAGRVDAEFWAPIWAQPMTDAEVRSLFLRGRAELDGKGATSPSSFATGVMSRGVDAGISAFRRFHLIHTTSQQTFESRLTAVVPVPKADPDSTTIRAIQAVVELHDSLPADRKAGKRWRFAGLRGPLEQALIDFTAATAGEGGTEPAWRLVDEVVSVLARVDRNGTFRRSGARFRLLPGAWAAGLLQRDPPDRESRIALAISSLVATSASGLFVEYRIGARRTGTGPRLEFPESTPARCVWNEVELAANLRATGERRVLEELRSTNPQPPLDATHRLGVDDLNAWLAGEVDEERVRLWLDRLCVFNWSGKENIDPARGLLGSNQVPPAVDGALALYALFRPLASPWLFRKILRESDIQAQPTSTCVQLGRIIAMLRQEDVTGAVEAAVAAYRAAGVPCADFGPMPEGLDSARLVSALVIPVRDDQVHTIFRRWRTPTIAREQ